MKNPFAPAPKDENTVSPETLQRWRTMQSHIGDRTPLEKLQPVVARIAGEKIEASWHQWARNSGQLFPEVTKDHAGREVVKYSGDIRAAFQPWVQEPIKTRLSEVTHFQGKTYLKGNEPADVRRSMALIKAGFSE